MPAITYREHAALFNKYKVTAYPYGKILLALSFTLLLSFSASYLFADAKNQKIEPVNNQVAYFDQTSSAYFKSKQSLDELRSSLQVAGVKTQKIDELREASAQSRVPGFFTTLGDIQKTADSARVARENIATERAVIEDKTPPELYTTLQSQIIAYMVQSEDFLTEIEKSQASLKALLTAATPAFFLPALSDETVWQRGETEEIKSYYEKRKEDAQNVLNDFAKVNTTSQLKAYKDLQTSHILLVVNVSENVVNVLNRPTTEDEESKRELIEEAYQVLVGAQRENEKISDDLASMRVNLSASASYSSELSSLKNREVTIESGLNAAKISSVY